MHVLHCHFRPERGAGTPARLILWAEAAQGPPPPAIDLRSRRPRPHPFAAPDEALAALLGPLWGTGDLWDGRDSELVGRASPQAGSLGARAARVLLRLPTGRFGPLPSPGLLQSWDLDPGAPRLRDWTVEGLAFGPAEGLGLLLALPPDEALDPGLALGDDLRFWRAAAGLALEALAAEKLLPGLVATGRPGREAWAARWQPVLDGPEDAPRLTRLARAMPPLCRADGGLAAAPEPAALVEAFLAAVIDDAARRWAAADRARLSAGTRTKEAGGGPADPTVAAWLAALFAEDPWVAAPPARLEHLAAQHAAWRRNLRVAGDRSCRVALQMKAPGPGEPGDAPWQLYFLLQARDDPSLLVPADTVWRSGEVLASFGRQFRRPRETLLAGLGYAARLAPPIRRALKARRPLAASLDAREAYQFLRETAPVLEQSGFGVLVPPWWNRPGTRLGVRLRVAPRRARAPGGAAGGALGLDQLVDFHWEMALGGERLDRKAFEALVALKSPLVQVRGEWVQLDPFQVEAALRFWQRQGEQANLAAALPYLLGAEDEAEGLPLEAVEAGAWLGDWVARLRDAGAAEALAAPVGLQATLRPYQERGLAWLAFLHRAGLGGILADDMGLGKTVQLLALLQHLRERKRGGLPGPVLLVCPTSVVTNWARECARFTPGLTLWLHQGADRLRGDELGRALRRADLVVTSYALVRRDGEDFAAVDWHAVVVDEAQNIKNAATEQARSLRRLRADWRCALTGTPVENRLAELWSILHFLSPGYLGSERAFQQRFARPIERQGDEAALRQLKRLTAPFILRRVKTDPSVIADLPEKTEMKVYCSLTPEQATLYASVVREALAELDASEGIQRSGLVLGMLTRLKQVCNHPAQLLHQIAAAGPSEAEAARSGKLPRLAAILEEALAEGDRALIFTQYVEMGHYLRAYLQERLGRAVLFLHGGSPPPARDRMIRRFQEEEAGPPVFILSLKAGGTGLNLTRANQVIHFDRWWNPAVENQATDRAFRIGQERRVWVHKFLCRGTLEEKIDAMIEAKKALAASVVEAGERWLTELSTAELSDLVALRAEALEE